MERREQGITGKGHEESFQGEVVYILIRVWITQRHTIINYQNSQNGTLKVRAFLKRKTINQH